MDTTTALMYDAVQIFALALHELSTIQDISIGSLDCSGKKSFILVFTWESTMHYILKAKWKENCQLGRIQLDQDQAELAYFFRPPTLTSNIFGASWPARE